MKTCRCTPSDAKVLETDAKCPIHGTDAKADRVLADYQALTARAREIAATGRCYILDGDRLGGFDVLRESPDRKAVAVDPMIRGEAGHCVPVVLSCGHTLFCNPTMMHRVGESYPCTQCGRDLGRAALTLLRGACPYPEAGCDGDGIGNLCERCPKRAAPLAEGAVKP